MNTTMIPAAKPANKPCHCGCGSPTNCCELECLVHPRFFCGQVLADQDLTALVDWIKNKTGLARFRHGWGVVCGLDVHCGGNGSVTVAPGYAMDCCGRDVVLCKEASFDLSPCWQRPPSACSTPSPVKATEKALPTQHDIPFSNFRVQYDQVQVFDVLVRYNESQSGARNAIARGGCGGAGSCEYTRVQEGYEIYCAPANGCEDPNDREFNQWHEEYRSELGKKLDEYSAWQQITVPQTRLQRVIEHLQRARPSTFCFLTEWLCDLQTQNEFPQAWDSELFFWIFQDWRNAYFRTVCKGCGPDTGIRLARVWLWRQSDAQGREVFKTLYINSHSPFRRALANDAWPAPAGGVNLAPYIWAPTDTAIRPLQQLGFSIERSLLAPTDLLKIVRRDVLVALPDNRLTVYDYPDLCGQRRIVCFTLWSDEFHPDKIDKPIENPIEKPVEKPTKTSAKDPPPDPTKLDLTEIRGIGTKISGKLKKRNIRTVGELAEAKPDDVKAALASIRNPPDGNELIQLAQKQIAASTKGS